MKLLDILKPTEADLEWLAPELFRRAAVCYEKAEMWDDAAECWQDAGDAGKAAEIFLRRLADHAKAAPLLLTEGQYEKALECYRKWFASIPDGDVVSQVRARLGATACLTKMQSDPKAAQEAYREARNLIETESQGHPLIAGRCWEALGEYGVTMGRSDLIQLGYEQALACYGEQHRGERLRTLRAYLSIAQGNRMLTAQIQEQLDESQPMEQREWERLRDEIERHGFRDDLHDALHFANPEAQTAAWKQLAAMRADLDQSAINEYLRSLAPEGMALIPAGEFWMGTEPEEIPQLVEWARQYYSGVDASWFERETPRHAVTLDAFYMDVYPVTNAQYRAFMDATGRDAPRYWDDSDFNAPEHPVVGVSWYDAAAYAQWAGKRLPTEAEWEKAARGGLEGKRFPWGDDDPDGTRCNFADRNTDYSWSDKNADDGYQYTSPVGVYPLNGYGLYDMAGNVWEWCMDEYDAEYYRESPEENPVSGGVVSFANDNFTNVKNSRVVRGGAWNYDPSCLRSAYRNYKSPTLTDDDVGFRCAGP